MSARQVFVTGSHTDVGKTHVACAMLWAARRRGWSVEALKPTVSGFDPDRAPQSDPGRLLAALGLELSEANLDAMSPWRFRAPLSPPMAARREGRRLELGELAAFCRRRLARGAADLTVVEGVGGLMSPIAEHATGLDLMTDLALPAVLVGGSYLGAMSHTLTSVVAAQARGVRLLAVVISQSRDPDAPDFVETVSDVRELAGGVPVVAAPLDDLSAWPGEVLDLT